MAAKNTPPTQTTAQKIEADRNEARSLLDKAGAAIDEAEKLISQLPKAKQTAAKSTINGARTADLAKMTAEIGKIDTTWQSAIGDPADAQFVINARQSLDTIRDGLKAITKSLEPIHTEAAQKKKGGGGSKRRTPAEIEEANNALVDAAAMNVVAVKERCGDVNELEVKAKKIAKASGVPEAKAAFSRLKAKADEVKKIPQKADTYLAGMRATSASGGTPASKNSTLEAEAAKIKQLLSDAEVGKREAAVLEKEVRTAAENGETVWYRKLFGKLFTNEVPWMAAFGVSCLVAAGFLIRVDTGIPYAGLVLWIGFFLAILIALFTGELKRMMFVNTAIIVCAFLLMLGPSQAEGGGKKGGSDSNSATIIYEVATSNPAPLEQGTSTSSIVLIVAVAVIAIVVVGAAVAVTIYFVKRSRDSSGAGTTATTP